MMPDHVYKQNVFDIKNHFNISNMNFLFLFFVTFSNFGSTEANSTLYTNPIFSNLSAWKRGSADQDKLAQDLAAIKAKIAFYKVQRIYRIFLELLKLFRIYWKRNIECSAIMVGLSDVMAFCFLFK